MFTLPGSFRILAVAISMVALGSGCAVVAKSPTSDQRQSLAPTGALRVGVYPGSPLSLLKDGASGEARGLIHDLGKAFAERLGVKFELVEMRTLAEVLAAVKSGRVDFAGTNVTPARAADMDFTPALLDIELGYLVAPGSAITSVNQLNQPGTRVGVTQGSTSQSTLPGILKSATIVPAPTLRNASEMLAQRSIDAFATNKVLLFEMSDGLQGSRVLEGQWGVERWAFAIPKGREVGMGYLRQFAEDAVATGLVKRAGERAGLRGTVASRAR